MKRIISLTTALLLLIALLPAQQPVSFIEKSPSTLNNHDKEAAHVQSGLMVLHGATGQNVMSLEYQLYPQPAIKDLKLLLRSQTPIKPILYVVDTEGQRTNFQTRAMVPDTYQLLQLNVKDLKEGMYFLVIEVPGVGNSEGMPIIKLDAQPMLIQ